MEQRQEFRYLDQLRGTGPFHSEERRRRDPIILITTDMVPPEFHRATPGFPTPRTPHLDRLRAGSHHFSNAFATSPVCTPSRASYLTGRYSYITTNSERAHDGHLVHLREDDPIFPEYLREVGYHARHVGKSHVGTAAFLRAFGENDSPWDRWSPPWFDDDGYLSYLHERDLEPPSFGREIRGRGADGGPTGNHYGGWIGDQDGRPFPVEATYPFYLVERAIQALRVAKKPRTDGARPLYLQLDFFGPHQPFAIPAGLEEREAAVRREVEAADIQGVPSGPEPRVYRLYRRNWAIEDRATIVDYVTANILQWEVIDAALGRLFDALEREGLYDESWVVFLADHGEMNGRHHLVDKGAYLNPQVLRVPLYLKAPAGRLPERSATCSEPVSLLDVAATMFDIAGVRPAARIDGVSLLTTLREGRRAAPLPVLFEIWSHVAPNPCVGRVLRASDSRLYLYTFNATDDIDELYLLGDTDELDNRAARLDAEESLQGVHVEAVRALHEAVASDRRFRAYAEFLTLEYPEILPSAGDRQHFFR